MTSSLIECHNIKVDKNDPRGTVWCPKCIHYTITNLNKKCSCCGFKLPTRPRAQLNVSVFENILKTNYDVISTYKNNRCPKNYESGWIIQLGIIKYFVPISYLAEFMEVKEYNDMRSFLETVKSECAVLPRFIKSVK